MSWKIDLIVELDYSGYLVDLEYFYINRGEGFRYKVDSKVKYSAQSVIFYFSHFSS